MINNGRFTKGKPGFWTGKKRPPFSEEWKANMNKDKIGKKRPQYVIDAIIKANLGKKHKEESKLKMSVYWMGKRRAEDNPSWKGNDIGKAGRHYRIITQLGRPRKCEHCGTEDAKRYDWANKDHKYSLVLSDWMRLCYKCHYAYDKKLRKRIKYGK